MLFNAARKATRTPSTTNRTGSSQLGTPQRHLSCADACVGRSWRCTGVGAHIARGRAHVAQRIQYQLIDDLDGGEAEGTVQLGLDGVEYEIDLSADNAGVLREAVAECVGHARRVGGPARRRTSRSMGRSRSGSALSTAQRDGDRRSTTQTIRDWAKGKRHPGEWTRSNPGERRRAVRGRTALSSCAAGGVQCAARRGRPLRSEVPGGYGSSH